MFHQTYQAEKKMHPAVILPAALSGLATQPLTARTEAFGNEMARLCESERKLQKQKKNRQ
jgi:uncharacterized small protein (DUF1192 family)